MGWELEGLQERKKANWKQSRVAATDDMMQYYYLDETANKPSCMHGSVGLVSPPPQSLSFLLC
jgi:hypothetical protein